MVEPELPLIVLPAALVGIERSWKNKIPDSAPEVGALRFMTTLPLSDNAFVSAGASGVVKGHSGARSSSALPLKLIPPPAST